MRIVKALLRPLIALSAMASPAAAQDVSWASEVREDGWPAPRVTADGDMLIFRRPAPKGPQGYPRLQLRYEYRDGTTIGARSFLSMLSLDEYDCKSGRFRNLRMAVFTKHNAQGESLQPPEKVGSWSTPAAGSVDGKSLATACGAR